MATLLWVPKPYGIDADWMDRRQGVLVPLANTPAGRRLFRFPAEVTPEREVTYLSPTGVIYRYPEAGPDAYQAVFYSGKPYYSKRAHQFLSKAAKDGWLAATLTFGGSRCLEMQELAAAAITSPTTFNPQANPAWTACDGYVAVSGLSTTWSAVRSAAGDTGSVSDLIAAALAQTATGGFYAQIRRCVLLFDSSALTAAARLLSAILSVYGNDSSDQLTGLSYSIVTCAPASNTTLVPGDYALANWNMVQQNTSDISFAGWTNADYNPFVLNTTGLNNVSLTAITKTGMVTDKDRTNTPPANLGANYFGFARGKMADNGSLQPKLVVTFTLPPSLRRLLPAGVKVRP